MVCRKRLKENNAEHRVQCYYFYTLNVQRKYMSISVKNPFLKLLAAMAALISEQIVPIDLCPGKSLPLLPFVCYLTLLNPHLFLVSFLIHTSEIFLKLQDFLIMYA